MAATRLIPMHAGKGMTLAKSIAARTDYAKNPEKTEKGQLVTSYACDPMTVEEEFLLQKRLYEYVTGKTQKSDVIAYQIRQSFKPGEITPEEANRLGYELAMRFTKGKYSFIVATHTDRAHIHNHIVYNSTAIDGSRKFDNFFLSSLALQRVSDLVCLENGYSVITPAPYRERKKRTTYPQRESIRDRIRSDISKAIGENPESLSALLSLLRLMGYEVKEGKDPSIKGPGQKRFIRLSSLGEGYTADDLASSFASGGTSGKPRDFCLLIDVQKKLQEKGPGYANWASIYNLKQMAKTLLFLRENGISTMQELESLTAGRIAERDRLLGQIKEAEAELASIAVLKKHIINYSKTRKTYEAYRKAGYSRRFYEEHRDEITLHQAAKKAFDELGKKTLPTVKELSERYAEVLTQKKKDYAAYRELRDRAQDYVIAQHNISSLYEAEEKEKRSERNAQPSRK